MAIRGRRFLIFILRDWVLVAVNRMTMTSRHRHGDEKENCDGVRHCMARGTMGRRGLSGHRFAPAP